MSAPVRHYHMYGELNVTFKMGDVDKCLYLPLFTSLKELQKRFLQNTHIDPRCFVFISNNKKITEHDSLYNTVENLLKDFVVTCSKSEKHELQEVNICFDNLKKKKEIRFKTFKKYINDKDLVSIVTQYLSLKPEDFTIKKEKSNKYVVNSNQLIILNADIQNKDVELIFSYKSTVLDLKYLASAYDPINCARLYINSNRESLNKTIVSKKFIRDEDLNNNDLTFQPYNNTINYKENEKSEIKQTTFDGAPIGRNIIRAIAKETKMSLEEANNKILVIESGEGLHTCKVKSTKFVKFLHDPFILLNEAPYEFEIHRGGKSTIQQIYIDPQLHIWQLRQYLSNLPNFVPSYFIKIKNQKGQIIDDQLKVEAVSKSSSFKFIVEIAEPLPVEATFILYNNENKKQTLAVDPLESSLTVIKTFANNFKISPSYIHIFLNNLRVIDNHKFINYYSKGTIYNIASELYVDVTYKENEKKLVFPSDYVFKDFANVCKQKFSLPLKKKVGFLDISSNNVNDRLLVYAEWEKKHIFPGPQYLARYQKLKDSKATFLMITQSTYERKYMLKPTTSTEEIELDVLIYTQDGRLESKVTKKLTEKVKNVVQEVLTDESQQDLDSSIFFVSEHELRPDSTIFDVQNIFQNTKNESSSRPKLLVLSNPQIYLYKLPGKSDFQFILTNPNMNLYDLRNHITKSSQMIIVKYDGEQVENLSQPIVFFNQRKPFMIEYVKSLSYKLIYNDSKEEHVKEQTFDETATIFNVLKESCDFLNKCENKSTDPPKATKKPSSMPARGSDKSGYKLTQIRVMINSKILTKEMEKDLLINDFGITGEVNITPLKKIGITIQGDNLHFYYFSENDTIMYVKKSILRRLEANEDDAPYYFILNNQIATKDSDLMKEYIDDDDLCLDIVPIQDTSKAKFIFPEFTSEFVIHKDAIMYDIKEYIGNFYEIDDPDLVELIDQATGEPVDDNDSPTNDQVLEVKINIENPKLDTKYSAKIQQYTKDGIISSETSSISDDTFKCPFTYKSSKDYNFDLILDKRNSAKAAKLRIANYLAKLNDDKDDDEQIDPDELMITINNKEVPNQEILFEKYKSASKSNPEIRFIVNKEVLDLTESNIFLATTKSVFFGSYEIF